jgi:hypothetical protein
LPWLGLKPQTLDPTASMLTITSMRWLDLIILDVNYKSWSPLLSNILVAHYSHIQYLPTQFAICFQTFVIYFKVGGHISNSYEIEAKLCFIYGILIFQCFKKPTITYLTGNHTLNYEEPNVERNNTAIICKKWECWHLYTSIICLFRSWKDTLLKMMNIISSCCLLLENTVHCVFAS